MKEKLWSWLFLTYITLYSVCGKGMKGETMNELKALTLNDVVQTLKYYNLKHCEFPFNVTDKGYSSGVVDFNKKQIYIDNELGGNDQTKTILHELAHAYYETKGIILSEKETDKVTKLTIDRYFKPKT